VSSHQVFRLKFVSVSHLSHTCNMPSPSCPRFDYTNNICWRVQVMTLLIMQSSPFSCPLSVLGLNILLSTLFSDVPNVCSLNVRDQVSYPYRTRVRLLPTHCTVFSSLEYRNNLHWLFVEHNYQLLKIIIVTWQNFNTQEQKVNRTELRLVAATDETWLWVLDLGNAS
jgi:hypothetical protein